MLAKLVGLFLLGFVRLLTGAQARWVGCPPKAEQRIYFANHQSHADLVMIWAALPSELRSITRPVAARDYWTKSALRLWITSAIFHAVYVERAGRAPKPVEPMEPVDPALKSPVSGASDPVTAHAPPVLFFADLPADDPLHPLAAALDAGDSIILFPEGTRGQADEPQPFKSGLYLLARMFPQVVLVPAWIDNIQRVMPKGEVVPVPILCSVTFGAPLQVAEGEQRRPFLDRAREAVMALRDV